MQDWRQVLFKIELKRVMLELVFYFKNLFSFQFVYFYKNIYTFFLVYSKIFFNVFMVNV